MIKAAIIASALLVTSTPSWAKQMTAAEIQKELIGKVWCVKSSRGEVCARHSAGGKSTIVSGAEKQSGTWRFQGNKHCAKWEKIRNGKEMCSGFDKTGGKYSNSEFGPVTVR